MSGPNGNGANPLLKRVAERAAACAGVEKQYLRARDAWLLAEAKVRQSEREIATAPLVESGLVVPPATLRRLERARGAHAAAEEEYREASDALSAALGALSDAQRDAGEWDRRDRVARARAEAEVQLTPEERAARVRAAAVDEVLNTVSRGR